MDNDRRQEHRVEDPVRNECYRRIRECMKTGIQAYYKAHPGRLLDDRSREALERSYDGLKAIFQVLDDYTITPKGPK